jgi:RNA polymerase sigma factor (sigma-70 family)
MKLDKDLLDKAIKDGDKDAILKNAETIIYYQLHITGLWQRYPNFRDDFLQEGRLAVLDAVKHWKSDGKASLLTYMHILVRNRIFSYIRSLKWLNTESSDYELDEENGNLSYDLKPLTFYDTLVADMNKEGDKETLKLYFLDEYTQDEVAKKVNKSQQWVNNTCTNFRDKMRVKYGKMFGINTTDERIKLYKRKNSKLVSQKDFKISGLLVDYWVYNDYKRMYEFYTKDHRVIATISDCDKMSKIELIRKFGDEL